MKAISTDILPVERACPSRGYVVRTKARRGTTAYWSAIRDYIPADGEIIVYSDYKTLNEKNIPGVKIGTGVALLQDLPFIDDADAADIAAKYTKPVAGIPKADLDSSVQASLDKADAALPADTPFKTVNGQSIKGTGDISITDAIEIQGSPRLVAPGDVFDEYFGASAFALLERGICGFSGDTAEDFKYIYYYVSGNFPLEDLGDGPTVIFDDGTTRSTITTRNEDGTIYVESLSEELSRVTLQQSLSPASTTKAPSVTAVKNRIEPIEEKIPSGASSSNKMVTASELNTLAGVVAGKMGVFGLDEYGGLKWITAGDAYDLSVDYEMVQAAIPDLAEIRQNAASPLHWLTSEAQLVEDGRVYTGTGILAAPGEFDVIKCYAVNYTDTAQTITCWRYPDTGSNAQTFTLAPFQVLALTCTIDEPQGSIWTASDSHYLREDKVFVATYGTTTAAEILAAYNAGKVVVCNYDNHTYMLSTTDSGGYIYLNTTYGAYLAYIRVNTTSNVWGSGSQLVEKAANRLTAAPSASDLASTDKYPSMKTAADYIADTAACSTTIRNIVTLTQAEYDALADYDAHTFYIII